MGVGASLAAKAQHTARDPPPQITHSGPHVVSPSPSPPHSRRGGLPAPRGPFSTLETTPSLQPPHLGFLGLLCFSASGRQDLASLAGGILSMAPRAPLPCILPHFRARVDL